MAGRERVTPIRVAVVDDHPAIPRGVADAADETTDIRVVGVAGDLSAGTELLQRVDVDVAVVDLQLEGGAEGLRLLERVSPGRGPALLVLSAFDYPALVRRAFELGAAGYLLKTDPIDDVLDAIRTVARGGTAFSADRLRAVRQAPRPPTAREREVVRHVAAGSTNDEIATRLAISLKTVESHLRRMFDRYGVLSRTELAVMAVRDGWLAVPDPERRQ